MGVESAGDCACRMGRNTTEMTTQNGFTLTVVTEAAKVLTLLSVDLERGQELRTKPCMLPELASKLDYSNDKACHSSGERGSATLERIIRQQTLFTSGAGAQRCAQPRAACGRSFCLLLPRVHRRLSSNSYLQGSFVIPALNVFLRDLLHHFPLGISFLKYSPDIVSMDSSTFASISSMSCQ